MVFSIKSIIFDGIDDYIDLGDETKFQQDYTDSFSMSCWAKTFATSAVNTLLGKMTSATGQQGYLMFLNASGQFEAVLRNTETTNSLRVRTDVSRMNDGGWHHFAMTYSQTNGIRLYIDGIIKDTTTVYNTLTSTILVSKSLQVGAYDGATNPFQGSIDAVAFFNDELSASEILDVFSSASPVNLSGSRALDGWWKFGDGDSYPVVTDQILSTATFPTIPDAVGGHDGTMTNMDAVDIIDYYLPWSNFSQYSYNFDGSVEHITMGDVLGFEYTDDFSISFWIRTSATSGYIVSKMLSSGNFTGYGVVLDSGGKVNVYLRNDNSPLNQIRVNGSTTGLNDSAWHHIVFTWKGNVTPVASDLHIYVDGGAETEAIIDDSLTGTLISAAAFTLGARNAGGDSPWGGFISDVSVYSKELSSTEVAAIYNSGTPNDLRQLSSASNLEAYWRIGEASEVPTATWPHKVQQWVWNDLYSSKSTFFDGAVEYAKMGDVPELEFDYDDPFSISVWFKQTSANLDAIVSKRQTSPDSRGYELQVDGTAGGTVRFLLRGGNSNAVFLRTTSGGYSTSGWHHALLTYSGNGLASGVNIYMDGSVTPAALTVIQDNLLSNTTVNSAEFNIATQNNGASGNWTGNIDDVAVYNVELPSADARVHYNRGTPGDRSGDANLVGYWLMGDGDTFPTITDNSSNSNNGTMVNMASNDFVLDVPGAEVSTITDASHLNSPGTLYNMESADVTPDTPGGISDYSCTFDGVDECMFCNVASSAYAPYDFENGEVFSIAGWVKTTDTDGWLWGPANRYATNSYAGYGVYLDAGRPTFIMTTNLLGTAKVVRRGNNTVNDGDWHFVVVTQVWISNNNYRIQIYVDSVLQPTTLVNNALGGSSIGSNGWACGGQYYIAGGTVHYALAAQIDEVSVWTKELTQADITALYNSGNPIDLRDHKPTIPFIRGWWRMGDKYTYPGTTVNMDYWDKYGAPGSAPYTDRSLAFDGVNDHLVVADNSDFDFDIADPFSVSMWVNPFKVSAFGGLIVKGTAGAHWKAEYAGTNVRPQGQIRVTMDGSAAGLIEVYVGSRQWPMPFGQWFHFVMTYDGSNDASNIGFYINGELWPTYVRYNTAMSGTMINTNPLWLGRGAAYLLGYMDEASVWKKELTQADVTEIWNGGDPDNLLSHTSVADLVSWWRMGEGPGNNGVMTNMVSADIVTNAPKSPGLLGQQINYYTMRGLATTNPATYHHWTVTGSPDFAGTYAGSVPPFSENSVLFRGGVWGLRVNVGSSSLLEHQWDTDSRTYSFWIRATSGNGVIGKLTAGGGGLRIEMDGGGGPRSVLFYLIEPNFGRQVSCYSNTKLTDGTWYHVAVVVPAPAHTSTIAMYINGVSGGVTTIANQLLAGDDTSAAGRDLSLGNISAASWALAGNLDEIAIYSSALSGGDVTALYNGGEPGNLQELDSWSSNIGWWRMGDGDTYPTITDHGNGTSNDGTMTSMSPSDITTDVVGTPITSFSDIIVEASWTKNE